jgi:hypothetical protein
VSDVIPAFPERRAEHPHCDSYVLHAPKVCRHCDKYPDRQEARIEGGTCFTEEVDPARYQDPATYLRTTEQIYQWAGNRPDGYGDLELQS